MFIRCSPSTFGLSLFAALFVTVAGARVAAAASFTRSDTGASIAGAKIETALSRSGIVARLGKSETVRVHGLVLQAAEPSLVYISLSSEFVIGSVLSGRLTSEGIAGEAAPGQMFVVSIAPDAKPALESFDIRQFLAAPPRGIPAPVRSNLEAVAASQANRVWWGSLQRTTLNVQALVPPLVEGVRRDYLLEPPIVRLRQKAGADPTRFAKLTADTFVTAMGNRDVDTVRALLHPTLFTGEGIGLNWLAKRHAFATGLARGPLGSGMRGAKVAVDSEGRIIVTGRGGQKWELVMSVLDVGVFVSAVEPRS
jgi:hypothetical protein